MQYKNPKNPIVIITTMGIVLTLLTSTVNLALAQQQPAATTDAQKYNAGYTDGLRVSKEDSKGEHGHGCDPTLSPGHSIPYQKGYAVGYGKGPCGEAASSLSGNETTSSPLPGILLPAK